MKRYNLDSDYGHCVIAEEPDGEYVLYEDHVEAMKRIAGDGGQQAAAICEACNGSGEGYAGSVCGHCLGRGEFLAEAMPDYKVRFETMVSMIGEISDALGIPDDEAACANGNDLILSAISQLRAPSAISHQEKLARFYPDFAVGIMRESTRGAWVRYVAAPSASAGKAEPVANNEAYDLAYDKIDRFLRSNLDDDDYSEFSRALDSLFAAPAPTQDTQVEPLPACRPGRWRDGDACEPAVPAPSASVQYAKREDAPYAPLPVPSASPAALTDSARRLMLAADDVDMGRSIHNQRKPDDKIEGAVWDELRRASAAVRAMLAASPAEQVEDARTEPTLMVPVEELVEALGHAKSLLEELPAHTVSGTRTAYAYNMVSAAINKVQRAAMSASREGA